MYYDDYDRMCGTSFQAHARLIQLDWIEGEIHLSLLGEHQFRLDFIATPDL